MATQKYWRCLSSLRSPPTRLPIPTYILGTSSAAFSTTAPLEKAGTPAGRKLVGGAQKGKKTLRLGGGKRGEPTKGKAPAPGERKAIRKRIVLSNTNAFEVPGIQDWSADNLAAESSLGTIVALPGATVDSLRAIEAFKATQGWGFFARPTTLIRAETLELARHIKNTNDKTIRKLVVGERGSGKSVLALQAQTMAFLNGWVVIHIPEGILKSDVIKELAHTDMIHFLSPGSHNRTYLLCTNRRIKPNKIHTKDIHRRTARPHCKSERSSTKQARAIHGAHQPAH